MADTAIKFKFNGAVAPYEFYEIDFYEKEVLDNPISEHSSII